MAKTAAELYEEREKRINDAIRLKVPDRVPNLVTFSFFAARYAGITCEEAMYDFDKSMAAWEKTITDFEPDACEHPYTYRLGRILEALDDKPMKWPGHGVDPNHTFQFVEAEYMKADEYDAFLFDLSDYMVRSYWPRIFGKLEPFKKLPPLHDIISYSLGLTHFGVLDNPEVATAMEALQRVKTEAVKLISASRSYTERMKQLGFPLQIGAGTLAPFDTISDFFRGTRGAMMDMYRNADKLMAATEKMLPIMLRIAINTARRTGCPRVFIPLHKGQEYFMSPQQFKTFYWPGLKKLMMDLIAAGLTPCPFFEGDYTSRLEIIGDIPRGKACYAFESTDIFKAKEIIGDQVCIRGNVPLSVLGTGTPEDVKDYCRKLIDVVGRGGGFIMDSAVCLDNAKQENVRAMMDFTREYGIYR